MLQHVRGAKTRGDNGISPSREGCDYQLLEFGAPEAVAFRAAHGGRDFEYIFAVDVLYVGMFCLTVLFLKNCPAKKISNGVGQFFQNECETSFHKKI